MMLWICVDCTTRYSIGASCCPQCGGTRYRPMGEEDGPIHVIGDDAEPGEQVDAEQADVPPARPAKGKTASK